MKRILLLIATVSLTVLITMTGCDTDYPPSPWNPDDTGNPNPIVTSVTPPDTSLEGVGIIQIAGQNFSSVPTENVIFFNAKRGTVLEATPTLLTVQNPVVLEIPTQNWLDSIDIKIAVNRAYEFGNYLKTDGSMYPYRLKRAGIEYGNFDNSDKPHAMDCDSSGALYVAGESKNIYKVTADGTYGFTKTTYSANTAIAIVTGMKMGPGGQLYIARKNKKIYSIPAGGGSKLTFTVKDLSGNVADLDFDQNGILWTAGKGDSVYAVDQSGNCIGSSPYVGFDIISVRIFNGYIYLAGTYSGDDTTIPAAGIWKNQITGVGTLGTREPVFNWTTFAGATGAIQSISFDEDGNLYVGAKETYDAAKAYVPGNAITIIKIDGSTEVLYPSIMKAPATNVTWNNGNYLFISRWVENDAAAGAPSIRVIRVELDKNSAPYYGRGL
ncbi:MAG: IPT/TIG domain-containing protein [Candidatus Marinimicrobia bacterium]|nr:IPT/TIG domain-containing protein [Candidatus Neomarinimicrobiota bacterium]